ncbi:MAG: hypothetical protein VX589_09635 [Myxococcota bacterium]|nr:hypothetical protein [Myxococcota bacterium]
MNLEPADDESLDVLSNRLRLLQRRRGHRAATDDVLLAWAGLHHVERPARFLDLGTGKGTVALLMLSIDTQTRGTGIEVYRPSYDLAVRNTTLNGMDARMTLIHGDLRMPGLVSDDAKFDLITGAPPFMPLGTGILPQDPQRASGRFELNGGVEAYFQAAARALAPRGRAVILMDGLGTARGIEAAHEFDLCVYHVIRVMPRPKAPPTYGLIVAGFEQRPRTDDSIAIRGPSGDGWTARYNGIRAFLDLPCAG